MSSGKTQEQTNNIVRQPYQGWAVGDGSTTEFALPKTVARIDDLVVAVNGANMRPADKGTAHDYKIRGFTPGYVGDKNKVKFTSAPTAGQNIHFIIHAP